MRGALVFGILLICSGCAQGFAPLARSGLAVASTGSDEPIPEQCTGYLKTKLNFISTPPGALRILVDGAIIVDECVDPTRGGLVRNGLAVTFQVGGIAYTAPQTTSIIAIDAGDCTGSSETLRFNTQDSAVSETPTVACQTYNLSLTEVALPPPTP